MDWPKLLVTSGLAFVVALLITGGIAYFAALRGHYERVEKIVTEMSSDKVAAARHRLGALIHDHPGTYGPKDRAQLVVDLFTALWTFDKIEAVSRSLPNRSPRKGPSILLKDLASPWVSYWRVHLQSATDRIDQLKPNMAKVDLGDSRKSLDRLSGKWS